MQKKNKYINIKRKIPRCRFQDFLNYMLKAIQQSMAKFCSSDQINTILKILKEK